MVTEKDHPRGGTFESDPVMNARIMKILGSTDALDSTVLENAVRAGLRDFPLSGGGRIFLPKKGREFLKVIEATGFPLDYASLTDQELWEYTIDTKEALRNLGGSHCPWVLREARAENAGVHYCH